MTNQTSEETKQMFLDALSPLADALASIQTENTRENSALKQEIDTLSSASSSQQESLDMLAETIGNIGNVYATKEENKSVETRLVQLQKAVRTNIDGIAALTELMSFLREQINAVAAALEELSTEAPPEVELPVEEEPTPVEPSDPETPTDPTPVDPEEPEPTDPETPPIEEEPPVDVPVSYLGTSAKINSFTDSTYWNKGTYRQKPGFSIPHSETNEKAFVVGAKIELADGQVRRINYAQKVLPHMSIFVDGPQVDAAKVGSPYSIAVTDKEINEIEPPVVEPETPPTPEEPEQTPIDPIVVVLPEKPADIKGYMGTAIGMGMGYPQLVPGELGHTFQLPTEDDVKRAMGYGMPLLRLGSLRERLIKPGLKSELYLGTDAKGKSYSLPKIRDFLRYCNSVGCKVMLDLFHNYGGFSEGDNAIKSNNPQHKKIGTDGGPSYDVFANDWKAIILYLKEDPEAWAAVYGIDNCNEWISLPSDNIFYAHQKFLDVCGPIMDDKMAVLEGNAYSNTPNFWDHNPRFKDLVDPRGPGFIEMSGHLYADANYSGMYETGDTVRAGENFDTFYINRVKPFLDGCEQYGFKANVGEWIVPGNLPKLLEGSRKGIEYALDRGCNFFVFGMGRGYSAAESNHWNLEIARNVPTLNVVKGLAARNKT